MSYTGQEMIEDIQDRLGNGRPPVEPEHFEGTAYEGEDDYYDRYEVNEAAGDLDSERGVSFQIRDTMTPQGVYAVNIKRVAVP